MLIAAGYFAFSYAKGHKEQFAAGAISVAEKVARFLPIQADTKKEIEAVNTLVSAFTANDNTTHTFLFLLQNNYELRPGGGFLGQYGILKVKNGVVVSFTFEDANLLDQRIGAQITPPYPLLKYLSLRNWKFRDSNWSPDFPTNAAKAEYFYRLAGGYEKFEGTIAVNADVFDHLLALTGPIDIPGYGTYTETDGAIKLESDVEKSYLGADVPAELKQARKNVMKQISSQIVSKLSTLGNIPKIAEFAQNELRDKNVMISLKDPNLQSAVSGVHWDGSVATDWTNDYLMIVDANMGALKTDYYIKRSLEYTADFTGDKPVATVAYTYEHTAKGGDWRTSDYHTYTRILAPTGSAYIENSRVKTGGVTTTDDKLLNKTIFGYKVDALIGTTLVTGIQYDLPSTISPDNYRLLIQKQSGVGTIPVKVTLKTKDGEFTQTQDLKKDVSFSFEKK